MERRGRGKQRNKDKGIYDMIEAIRVRLTSSSASNQGILALEREEVERGEVDRRVHSSSSHRVKRIQLSREDDQGGGQQRSRGLSR